MLGLCKQACLAGCMAAILLAGCSRQHEPPISALGRNWQKTVDFDRMDLEKAPPKFTIEQTHEGQPPVWTVKHDSHAASGEKVLAQSSADSTKDRYPLCLYPDFVARNVAVSVQFKTITGKVDQAGGIVVRYLDRDNYYVARANALEHNIRFYKVEKGQRTQLADAKVDVVARQWQTLEIKAKDANFEVFYNGQRVIQAEDKTFDEPGRVGLWTKADSVTFFDNLRIR
jgi:hypothetical protein